MDALAHGMAERLADEGARLLLFPADLRGAHRRIGPAQHEAVEAAIAARVEVIVLFVLDMNGPARAVGDARARGVPVVAIHKPVYSVNAAIMVPNYHQGVVLAHALRRALPSETMPKLRVGIVGGPQILDDVELVRGAVDGVRGCGIELVNDPFVARYRNLDDVRGAGRLAIERLLDDAYPFDGCVVFNDETLLDALQVLHQRGLTGKLPTVSRNGSPEVIEALKQGKTCATFDYHLPEIGKLAASTALRCLGSDPPTVDTLVAAPFGDLFTARNVTSYVPWEKRAHHGELVLGGT
jgi:ABC-type sugar transport system substrate-binding protein